MRTIKRVIRTNAIEAGHAIEIDLEMDDGSQETLRCVFQTVSTLVQTIVHAGAAAARMQQLIPGQPLAVVEAHRAIDCRTGTADGAAVIEFSTRSGAPVQIAMDQNLARKAIERLEAALRDLGTQPPPRTN
jgi:hypothetical protein